MKKIITIIFIMVSTLTFTQERIVSLAPGITEILFEIGAGKSIVGRTSACDYPSEAKKIEIAGDFVNPSIEKIISLKPTVIIGMDLNDAKMAKFGEMGIKYENIKIKKVEDIAAAIRIIGKITGFTKNGEAKAKEFEKRLEEIKTIGIDKRPKVFILIWNSPIITAGKSSIISDVVIKAGGINIAGEINSDYPVYSVEQIIAQKPDFILSDPNMATDNMKINGEKIRNIDPDLIFRPGPRLIDGIEKLHEIFDKRGKK